MAIHFHIIEADNGSKRHLGTCRLIEVQICTYVRTRAINTPLNTSQADPQDSTRINVYDRNGF